ADGDPESIPHRSVFAEPFRKVEEVAREVVATNGLAKEIELHRGSNNQRTGAVRTGSVRTRPDRVRPLLLLLLVFASERSLVLLINCSPQKAGTLESHCLPGGLLKKIKKFLVRNIGNVGPYLPAKFTRVDNPFFWLYFGPIACQPGWRGL